MFDPKREVRGRRSDERSIPGRSAVCVAWAACILVGACAVPPSAGRVDAGDCLIGGLRIDAASFERARARQPSTLADCASGAPEPVPSSGSASPVPVIRIDRVPMPTPATPATDPPARPATPRGGAVPALLTPPMRRLDARVNEVAQRNALDPLLLHAVIHVESRHRSDAVSPAGARGAMQLMPGTAERFGVADPRHLHDDAFNLAAGAALLKSLLGEFDGDLDLVLAAYNAGEGAVRRYGRRVPPFPETQAYVRDVRAEYRRLQARLGDDPSRRTVMAGGEP